MPNINISVRTNDSQEITDHINSNVSIVFNHTPIFPENDINIIFTEEFQNDVESFQKNNNLKEGISEHAKGRVFSLEDINGILKHFIFLNFETFKPIFELPATECLKEINLLHHEVGHLVDNQNTYKIFPETFSREVHLDMTDRFFLEIASISWAEYQANYVAAKTIAKESIKVYFASLIGCLECLNERIKKAKIEIKKDYTNCLEIQYLTKEIFYCLGQIRGLIDGINVEQHELKSDLQKIYFEIGGQYFYDELFKEVDKAFAEMQETYPNWPDYNILRKLCHSIVLFLHQNGINVNDNLLFYLK